MKLFECIIDDGRDVFKSTVAAKNKKDLTAVYGGNGDFVKITDVTADYFTDQSPEMLDDDLARCGWGVQERTLLKALLEQHIASIKR